MQFPGEVANYSAIVTELYRISTLYTKNGFSESYSKELYFYCNRIM